MGKLKKIVFGVLVGGLIGFLAALLVKCSSGTCPLAQHPWITVVIGALAGAGMAYLND